MLLSKLSLPLTATVLIAASLPTLAADYQIDSDHSFVEFRIQHLGYSWLYGRFNHIKGDFSYDADSPTASKINVEIDTASIDTNHAERDKHLRSADFLNTNEHSNATFKGTQYTGSSDSGMLEGELTLNGVSKILTIEIEKVGEGQDPWGGYRTGFIGKTTLTRKDFGIDYNLGPAAEIVELELSIEGIRQ